MRKIREISYWRQETPVGPLSIYKTSKGVCAIKFASRIQPSPHFQLQAKRDLRISRQLRQYFQGERTTLEIPIDLWGVKGFTRKVLETLYCEVHHGERISYGALASKVGQPGAARAVGQAMRKNPIPIVIPCHRVVASNGSLGGYSAGLRRKQRLLTLEKAVV